MMIRTDWNFLLKLVAVAIILVCLQWVIIHHASASDNVSSAVVIEEPTLVKTATPTPTPTIDPHPYLQQGDTVYLGDTVDISGVAAGYWDLAYWDGYDMYDETPKYNITLPDTKEGYWKFYIDPAIFGTHLGNWYRYNRYYERAGNNLAFKVESERKQIPMTLPNGSVINKTVTEQKHKELTPYILPERPLSDYICARGDTLTIPTDGRAKVWIAGRTNGLYDYETPYTNITFSGNLTQTLEPGRYTVVTEYPGANNEYDVRFHNTTFYNFTMQYRDGWNGIKTIDINGDAPTLVTDKLIEIINLTDDKYTVSELIVDDPTITVGGFTEVPLASTYFNYQYYRTQPGVVSMFDVRGYTNSIPGTNISVVLDKDRHTSRDIRFYTFYTESKRQYAGNMSYYQVYVPIVWDDMTVGIHSLTVTDTLGAQMKYDFPVSILPNDSYKPNATVKYALDENPWKPNLTTVTVEVTKEIIKERIVEKEVTPSPEQIKNAQKVVEQERWDSLMKMFNTVATVIILALAGYFGIRYALSIRRRL